MPGDPRWLFSLARRPFFIYPNSLIHHRAEVAELADAPDSKSGEAHPSCGFDSHLRHQNMPAKRWNFSIRIFEGGGKKIPYRQPVDNIPAIGRMLLASLPWQAGKAERVDQEHREAYPRLGPFDLRTDVGGYRNVSRISAIAK